MPTGQAFPRWIDENGYRPLGLLRVVYLDRGDDHESPMTVFLPHQHLFRGAARKKAPKTRFL
jgi:hypothetical protein